MSLSVSVSPLIFSLTLYLCLSYSISLSVYHYIDFMQRDRYNHRQTVNFLPIIIVYTRV